MGDSLGLPALFCRCVDGSLSENSVCVTIAQVSQEIGAEVSGGSSRGGPAWPHVRLPWGSPEILWGDFSRDQVLTVIWVKAISLQNLSYNASVNYLCLRASGQRTFRLYGTQSSEDQTLTRYLPTTWCIPSGKIPCPHSAISEVKLEEKLGYLFKPVSHSWKPWLKLLSDL